VYKVHYAKNSNAAKENEWCQNSAKHRPNSKTLRTKAELCAQPNPSTKLRPISNS